MTKPNKIAMPAALAEELGIRTETGWSGSFTRREAANARFKNGTRVVKFKSDPGDTHVAGTQGTVLGSIYAPTVGFGYFVEWDSEPRAASFVVGWKLAREHLLT